MRIYPTLVLGLLSIVIGSQAVAQTPSDDEAARKQRSDAAWVAAGKAMVKGPQDIPLMGQATLRLPVGYAYIPVKESRELMTVMGNQTDGRFAGLVMPLADDGGNWFVTIDWIDDGFVKDDDAKEWDATELLESLREGTEEGNKERVKAGVEPIMVAGWIEAPRYDASNHKLVWSVEVKDKNRPDPDPSVNYNTYVLGREGYLSLNLVTGKSSIDADKPAAQALLAATTFNEGKRYSDFNPSSDKVAEYGLAALVAGAAAKKLGLFALIGAFLAKFAKFLLIAAVAAGGAIKKFFTGRGGDNTSGEA